MKISARHFKKIVAFIWRYVRLQRGRFILMLILSFTWSLDATLWPYLLRLIIDVFTLHELNRAEAWDSLKGLLICGGALLIFVEFGFRLADFIRAKAIPQLEADIRMGMFDHIQRHSPKYFNDHFAGSLSNKINDMTTQVTLIINNLRLFLPALAISCMSVGFFLQVHTLFAIILAVWITIQFAIFFAFTPKCVANSKAHAAERSSLAGKVVDSLTNNFVVNLFFRFQFERARILLVQDVEKSKNTQVARLVAWMFLTLSTTFLIGAFILNGCMVLFWLRGGISTGEVIQIFNTVWNVIFIIWVAGERIPQFFQSLGIVSQALSVMEDPQDIIDQPNALALNVKQGEIVFDQVSFFYGNRQLFSNKNVHIKGGEKIGLVGFSGAGKSTFVNLILRFHQVDKGRILIDGQDIAHVTLESLRQQVALIPQEPQLFHRSVEENIQYGHITASQEEVVNAAKQAHCDEFIHRYAEGYGSLVGERGAKLSGGERQRLAIARAMLAQSPILILDEATSALDSVTEKYIQDSLEKIMENKTTIVIAHRLSTLAKMDRILVFDQGAIVEQGSHHDLLVKGGHYARLWQMQAGGFLPDKR